MAIMLYNFAVNIIVIVALTWSMSAISASNGSVTSLTSQLSVLEAQDTEIRALAEALDTTKLLALESEIDTVQADMVTQTARTDALGVRATTIEAKQVVSDYFYTNPDAFTVATGLTCPLEWTVTAGQTIDITAQIDLGSETGSFSYYLTKDGTTV